MFFFLNKEEKTKKALNLGKFILHLPNVFIILSLVKTSKYGE